MTDGPDITRRRVLGAVSVVGASAALGGASTAALFSDEETFANNRLVAGELDLKVGWQTHYSDGLGTETHYGVIPGDGETPDLVLPPAAGQTDARPVERSFVDPAGDEGGADSRPGESDGGRQFLRNTALASGHGGVYGGPDDLCGTDADVGADSTLFELDDVKPGDFGFGLFRLALCDNPGFLWFRGGLVGAAENGLAEPEAKDPDEDGDGGSTDPADVELLDAIQVAYGVGTTNDLAAPPGENPFPTPTGGGTLENQTSLRAFLSALSTGGVPLVGDIPAEDGGGTGRNCFAGETDHYLSFVWWLPVDHANQVQGDSVTFDLGFYAEQCRHNASAGGAGQQDDCVEQTLDLSTGSGAWEITSGPIAGDPAAPANRHPSWVGEPDCAAWIVPPGTDGTETHPSSASYVYEATFTVPENAGDCTLSLGPWAADNQVEFYLDGAPSPLAAYTADEFGWQDLRDATPTTVTVGPGSHALRAEVTNLPPSFGDPTPSGLLACVSVDCVCEEP